MGFHWAKLLKSHGVEVLTFDRDRGEVSRKRGENAGVKSVPSMAELVQSSELIVSIVVPSAAMPVRLMSPMLSINRAARICYFSMRMRSRR
jgi:3-hydroxyisobutyrate dehydrogenase-like beta-hydroxyacid dehydrogenase